MSDVTCNECGAQMEWGEEYQLAYGSDHDCHCRECYRLGKEADA